MVGKYESFFQPNARLNPNPTANPNGGDLEARAISPALRLISSQQNMYPGA